MEVFFFQAEDGIRGGHVTGVQTCALPISPRGTIEPIYGMIVAQTREPLFYRHLNVPDTVDEIGRASCRERVKGWAAGGAVENRRGESGWSGERRVSGSGSRTGGRREREGG